MDDDRRIVSALRDVTSAIDDLKHWMPDDNSQLIAGHLEQIHTTLDYIHDRLGRTNELLELVVERLDADESER